MEMEKSRWHSTVLQTYNSIMFDTLLYPHNIITESAKSYTFEDVHGIELDGQLRGYFAMKEINGQKNKYFIEEEFFTQLPLRINNTEEIFFKESARAKSVVLRPTDITPFKITPQQCWKSHKEFIDTFAPFEHSNISQWTLNKIMAIMGYVGKTFCCISSNPEFGKCHGKGTKILMYDGSIKLIEDVKKGDLVMGDDSTPRKVVSTVRGYGPLYQIQQKIGEPYIVNDKHILCLRHNRKKEEVEISVEDYLKQGATFKHCALGYKKPVSFPYQHVDLDPYILGIWLGDGTLSLPAVTTPDDEVVKALYDFAKEQKLEIRKDTKPNNKASTYTFRSEVKRDNHFTQMLRNYGLFKKSKKIPQQYLINSKEVRFELLAGILDSDGYLIKKGSISSTFEIIQKGKTFSDQISFLARSLGFRVNQSEKNIIYKGQKRTYQRITIGGEIHKIPTRIKRKQAEERYRLGQSLNTSIKVVPLGEGEYFGFQLDGNHKYLLHDFTVTHNSSIYSILDQITKKCPLFQPRSAPGILIQITGDGNMVFDDIHASPSEVRKVMENFTFKVADGSSTYRNGAIKSKHTRSRYDVAQQSITYLYNRYQDYTDPTKQFWDNIWGNPGAMSSRFMKVQFKGKLLEKFDTNFNTEQVAQDNKMYYIKVAKHLLWLKQQKSEHNIPLKWTANNSCNLKGRQKAIYDEIVWGINIYAQDQQEFTKYVSLLDECIKAYKEMSVEVTQRDEPIIITEEIVDDTPTDKDKVMKYVSEQKIVDISTLLEQTKVTEQFLRKLIAEGELYEHPAGMVKVL